MCRTTCENQKCIYNSTKKITSFSDCKKRKTCCHELNVPFKVQKPTLALIDEDGTISFTKKTNYEYKFYKRPPGYHMSPPNTESSSDPVPKQVTNVPCMAYVCRLPLADT